MTTRGHREAGGGRRVGLVLGAGGATGHGFHCGLLAAIADVTGFDARTATVVVGTSAGSSVGALVRAGLAPRDLLARACGEQPSTEAQDIVARLGPPPRGFELPEAPTDRRPASTQGLLSGIVRPWNARVGTIAAAALPEGTASPEAIIGPYRRLFGDSWPAGALRCAPSASTTAPGRCSPPGATSTPPPRWPRRAPSPGGTSR